MEKGYKAHIYHVNIDFRLVLKLKTIFIPEHIWVKICYTQLTDSSSLVYTTLATSFDTPSCPYLTVLKIALPILRQYAQTLRRRYYSVLFGTTRYKMCSSPDVRDLRQRKTNISHNTTSVTMIEVNDRTDLIKYLYKSCRNNNTRRAISIGIIADWRHQGESHEVQPGQTLELWW